MATTPPPVNPSNPPRSRKLGYKSRHVAELSNVPGVGRTVLASRIQKAAAEAPPAAKFPNLIAFFQFWKWAGPYLRDIFTPLFPYKTYPLGENGIFDLHPPDGEDRLIVAAAGDWGTGTLEAANVAANIKDAKPHCTIHLGDVYYVGEAEEVRENCLGKPSSEYTGVSWPRGSLGTFALIGNHEMYSGGRGYFKTLLPTMGLGGPDDRTHRQHASFFCMNTPRWLILGLDTGYHAGGMPWFAGVPLINKIPALNLDAHFDKKLMSWLKKLSSELKHKKCDDKPVLVLTHHQPISSFEPAFLKPARQLVESEFLNGREFVWLFGHEHRLAIYNQQEITGGLTFYPRCIGHGGMPIKVTKPKANGKVLYYDPRQHPIDKDNPQTQVGYNGHALLTFRDDALTIEYRDIDKNKSLLSETFKPKATGTLVRSQHKPEDSPLISG